MRCAQTVFFTREERREHLLPLIALTYLTFPDTKRWAPALKPRRYVKPEQRVPPGPLTECPALMA